MPKAQNAQTAKSPKRNMPEAQNAEPKICLDMPGYALIIEKAQVPKVPRVAF